MFQGTKAGGGSLWTDSPSDRATDQFTFSADKVLFLAPSTI